MISITISRSDSEDKTSGGPGSRIRVFSDGLYVTFPKSRMAERTEKMLKMEKKTQDFKQ